MKERRRFFRRLGGLAAMMALGSSRNRIEALAPDAASDGTGILGGPFVHMVFFWLVDETMGTKGKFITELMQFIDKVEVIKTKHVGRAADTDREVVDNTYSYCLIVTFDSKADHDIYQEHPLHKQFIENASHLWTKVQVYDSVRC